MRADRHSLTRIAISPNARIWRLSVELRKVKSKCALHCGLVTTKRQKAINYFRIAASGDRGVAEV